MVILEIIGFIILAVIVSVVPFAVHLLALEIIDDTCNQPNGSKQDIRSIQGALYFTVETEVPSVEQIRKLCMVKRKGKDVLNVRMVCTMLGIKRIPRKSKKNIKRLIGVL